MQAEKQVTSKRTELCYYATHGETFCCQDGRSQWVRRLQNMARKQTNKNAMRPLPAHPVNVPSVNVTPFQLPLPSTFTYSLIKAASPSCCATMTPLIITLPGHKGESQGHNGRTAAVSVCLLYSNTVTLEDACYILL